MTEHNNRAHLPAADGQPAYTSPWPAHYQDEVDTGAAVAGRWLEAASPEAALAVFDQNRHRLPGRRGLAFEAGFLLRVRQRLTALEAAAATGPQSRLSHPASLRLQQHFDGRIEALQQSDSESCSAKFWALQGQIELALMAGWLSASEADVLDVRTQLAADQAYRSRIRASSQYKTSQPGLGGSHG